MKEGTQKKMKLIKGGDTAGGAMEAINAVTGTI